MRGSLDGLPLRAALTRGALVAAANWPLVLLQFAVTSVVRLAAGIPVVGGAFMVAVVAGADARALLSADVRTAAGLVAAALADRPGALASFVTAVGVVALGGALVGFVTQAGTASLLVRADRQADVVPPAPLRPSVLRTARATSLAAFLDGVRLLGRRFLLLGLWLCVGYLAIGALALVALRVVLTVGRGTLWDAVWGLGALPVVAATVIAIGGLHLLYALIQVIVATDDCRVSEAVQRLHAFVRHDARQVAGVFGVVLALVLLTSAASLLATAGLALVAWVPFVGLVVVPLQVAAWLVRGVVFHYMELGAWSAYQGQYRRYRESP